MGNAKPVRSRRFVLFKPRVFNKTTPKNRHSVPVLETTLPQPNETVAAENLLNLGILLGQNLSFGLIAGRCSAAQAATIRRIREEGIYKQHIGTWEGFCAIQLKMARTEADKIIRLLEEFGPQYFEVSQLTRVSPETYRAIAPAVRDGVLHHNGEAIELNPENARKVAVAVDDLRRNLRTAPRPPAAMPKRIRQVEKRFAALLADVEELARSARETESWNEFTAAIERVKSKLASVQ